jgi:hypothetical protein
MKTIAVASGLLFSIAVHAAPPPPEWTPQTHPETSGQDHVLESVSARANDDVWAVGRRFGTVGNVFEFRTYALHWDGLNWTPTPTRDFESYPTTNFLNGVDALPGSSTVWAVGWYRNGSGGGYTLTERWDGSAWTIVPSPSPVPAGSYLESVAVASENEAWAVGSKHDLAVDELGMILHWDGNTWTETPMPRLPFCYKRTELYGVATRPTGRAFVTGYCISSQTHQNQAFLLRWTGSRWVLALGPKQLGGPITTLNDVTFVSASEAWAVGSRQFPDENRTEPLMLHLVGGQWIETAPPADANVVDMTGVAAAGPKLVWAVGLGYSSQPPFSGRRSMRWDGSGWTLEPAGDFGNLDKVDVTRDGHAWAVGQNVEQALIVARKDRRPR